MTPHRARRWFVLAVVPLLIAASDPRDDRTACAERPGSGDVPDLLEARGEIVEMGTSARWELTFAEPLTVPDAAGRPFRIDIVLHDPDVPAESFDYYRDMNRLVRVDATIEHPTEIYLLPERASNVFNPPIVEGSTIRIQVPGRTLSDDEDLTGTSPGLEALRWTVIVRDENACDFLGAGYPNHRLVPVAETRATAVPDPPAPAAAANGTPWPWIVGVSVGIVVAGFGAYVVRRAR